MRSVVARRVLAIVTLRTLIAIAAAVVFVAIAKEVIEGRADAFDRPLAHTIRSSLDSPFADALFEFSTHAGSWPALSAATLLTGLLAIRRRHWRTAVIIATNVLVAEVLNALLKALFTRDRPDISPAIEVPASYSFPSGHAMGSLAIYATLALVIAGLAPRARVPAAVGAALLVLTIGLSRIYLGVHWPLDVLAGYAAAVPLVVVTIHLVRRLDPIDRPVGERAS